MENIFIQMKYDWIAHYTNIVRSLQGPYMFILIHSNSLCESISHFVFSLMSHTVLWYCVTQSSHPLSPVPNEALTDNQSVPQVDSHTLRTFTFKTLGCAEFQSKNGEDSQSILVSHSHELQNLYIYLLYILLSHKDNKCFPVT